jgi:predicted AlkP superfamily phosphohydrolase/phosphomutase
MGEHGMRPAWMSFRPNVVLKTAGIVVSDSSGAIDLTRTRAAATRGWWISVNRTTRKGGIVSRDSVDAVLDRVERALLAVRDSTGSPIVTQVWRSTSPAADSLGLGGPAGGDLYYALAPGYYPNVSANGAVASALPLPRGEHGFPSVDRDMWPMMCVLGTGASAKRIGPVRAIDVAPTVAEWLGISAPADSRGVSLLRKF